MLCYGGEWVSGVVKLHFQLKYYICELRLRFTPSSNSRRIWFSHHTIRTLHFYHFNHYHHHHAYLITARCEFRRGLSHSLSLISLLTSLLLVCLSAVRSPPQSAPNLLDFSLTLLLQVRFSLLSPQLNLIPCALSLFNSLCDDAVVAMHSCTVAHVLFDFFPVFICCRVSGF